MPIEDETLGRINAYVTEEGIGQEKSILFLSSGTNGLPVMLVADDGETSVQLGTIHPDVLRAFEEAYHVVFIGKAGTPFCDTTRVEAINPMHNLENYRPSDEYVRKAGMEWEVAAMKRALDLFLEELATPGDQVIAVGFSEGGRLVIRLAAEDDRITHVVPAITGGLNQFYSSIINRRFDAVAGRLTHHEAQAQIDSLFAVYKRIYTDPASTEKWYFGHPYKRWGSYCSDIPLENLLKLEIPILFIHGTADRSSPILQADYVQLEFLRMGKDNLTNYVLPGVVHSLHEIVEEDGEHKAISRQDEVLETITEWIAAH
jgi:pimeloyl-ACP methyl ester carboxylesterase